MSRSKPSDNTPNPSRRWYEWSGSEGVVKHYDKEAVDPKDKTKKGVNIMTKLPFTFILLDETSSVRGWHEASESGIYSNEVRDTRQESLVVKSFKGGLLAEGFYAGIRDRVASVGGKFTMNLYLGFKDEAGALQIGCLQLHGASLNAWVEFRKKDRDGIYKKAIKITGFTQHRKGKVDYRMPTFALLEIGDKTQTEAVTLDTLLQNYFKGYFARTTSDKVSRPVEPSDNDGNNQDHPPVDQQAEPEPQPEAPSGDNWG